MWIADTVKQMRIRRGELTGRIALVPTLGGLHAGHASLMQKARQIGDQVIATIFLNPTQFGPHEDLARYPRTLNQDLAMCREHDVDGVFMPEVYDIYPPQTPACQINVPQLATDLEGLRRPDHFEGVCRVVAKFFNITAPHCACFGQKDFQQLRVIQAMVADLNLPIMIVQCPTVRESDGLALSTRNRYLNDTDRRHATGLYKALCEAKSLIEQDGETDPLRVEAAMAQTLRAHRVEVDYAAVRHPLTLAPLDSIDSQVVALVAGKLGDAHLLDNMLLGGAR